MQSAEEDQSKPGKGPFCRKQEKAAKHAARFRGLWVTESDGDASQMPYVPNEMKGRTTKLLLREQEQVRENFMNSCLKNVNDSHHKISWQLLSFTTKYSQRHALKSSTPTSLFPNTVHRMPEARI
jgi:hypothetical protein